MSKADDDRTTLAPHIAEARRLANDPASLVQWIATLSERERAALTDWAQRHDTHIAQTLARAEEISRRISDDSMP
jgi:hypothetical protein